jgi:hypothetical protein
VAPIAVLALLPAPEDGLGHINDVLAAALTGSHGDAAVRRQKPNGRDIRVDDSLREDSCAFPLFLCLYVIEQTHKYLTQTRKKNTPFSTAAPH